MFYSPYNINSTMIFMAGDNPNYNVHMLAASLSFKW
jgi:hypothetical protein